MSANVKELIEKLQELKSVNFKSWTAQRRGIHTAWNLLYLIFDLGINKIQFSEKDKKIIGELLVDTIDPIQISIESTAGKFRTRLETSILIKRSALQFLVDDYSSFPVGTSTLSSKFEEVNIKESITILDKVIDTWRDFINSDEPTSDREEAGGSEVPQSHTWWF